MGVDFLVRRGRTSIVREVKESLQAIDKIGQSKRDARRNGDSGIHSVKQKANTMSDSQNFVKWCRSEYGVKSIADLQEDHYRGYMAYLTEKGVTRGHMRNVETSMRLLEKGFQKRSERFEGASEAFKGFCPAKRVTSVKTAEGARNRSYSAEEVEKIKENCSKEVQRAVDLMREMGLRVKEAVNVRSEHFVRVEEGWRLEIERGGGITKGGRFRHVPVPERFEQRLEQMLETAHDSGRLVAVSQTTVRDGVNVACKKAGIVQDGRGTHGFRHAYARERFEQLATAEQRGMMTRILENRSVGRPSDYGIHGEQKSTYFSTKNVMDKVHGELGHGVDRWELAVRYLGE